jgi:hypothetical protein
MSELLHEVTQLQSQAVFGADRIPEIPLFQDGRVPTVDGFHWCAPSQ